MKLDITTDYPPNYDEIVEHIPEAQDRRVIFAYAPQIYNPSGVILTPAIREHEAVHLRQQGDDPQGWWERYLASIYFRFGQELEAHQAEYRWWRAWRPNRAQDAKRLIAERLRSPLYGAQDMLEPAQAERLIETRESLDDL